MNAPNRPKDSADLAALAMATDADGQVDLTALEAHRLILNNQTIQGLDAQGLVNSITRSPAYADPKDREEVGTLIDAISKRLPPADAMRFDKALDAANVNESWAERTFERYVQEPVAAGWEEAKARGNVALNWTDAQISDNLAQSRRWAQEVRDNPQNSYLERAAGAISSELAGSGQDSYGAMKGATSHGLSMLGDTVDLAKFAYEFRTDENFRNLVIGAASVYANQAIDDPGKVPRDIKNAAIGAWNEWEKGLEQATREGKAQEYLGQAKGAAAIEIIATFVPVSKLTKLGKVAKVADGVEDLAGEAGRVAGRVERHAAGELGEELLELAHDARQLQSKGGLEAKGADLMFHGLAGVKRSQGELGELVDGLRKSGHLDGLLDSGALTPKELGYLARQDVSMFNGSVSFEQAITKSVGGRELSALTRAETGDIGEAIVSHRLAEQGYRDLVPIQNNSGHGNDLAGFNPESGRWEVIEVKASVIGAAKDQVGDPQRLITSRLERAIEGRGHWDAKNMWEQDAKATAERLIDNHFDEATRQLDIDSKWARVNLEKDPATGHIQGEPQIERWQTPAERALERSNSPTPTTPGRTPVSPEHPDHAMHEQIRTKVTELGQQHGVSGEVNDRMTASLLTLAKDNGLTRVDHVLLSNRTASLDAATNVFVVQGSPNDPAMLRAHMPTAQAAQTPLEQSFNQLEQVNQRLAQSQAQQQTLEQTQSQNAPQMRMS
ncbi:XVIPCD domain-containing protein [Xanthomonas phaseoli]|uniref:XVIPCD domain-containing protein n=1 Tax=Xanthomonas phaseoli TaxID=1985254 RepID=UPI0002DDBAB0|nr:XVIPCD domain-containing protein [Xanthomonas phaseoli]